MTADYSLLLGLYGAGLVIRNGYELFKRAGKADGSSRLVFGVVFVAMCLMWIGWFNMCRLDPWPLSVPEKMKIIGTGAVLVGLGLSIGSFLQLRSLENTRNLVTTGLYAKLRHPMYAGFILWILGWSVRYGAVRSFAGGLAGIASIICWQRPEEAALESRFGEIYRAYRKKTWF
jgi:protein-S-isoprenylcysteine O-methyltransferase Ste14